MDHPIRWQETRFNHHKERKGDLSESECSAKETEKWGKYLILGRDLNKIVEVKFLPTIFSMFAGLEGTSIPKYWDKIEGKL